MGNVRIIARVDDYLSAMREVAEGDWQLPDANDDEVGGDVD